MSEARFPGDPPPRNVRDGGWIEPALRASCPPFPALGNCPGCAGLGTLTFTRLRLVTGADGRHGHVPVDEKRPCPICSGSGSITPRQQAALAAQEARAARLRQLQDHWADALELLRILAVGLALPVLLVALSSSRFVHNRLHVFGLRFAAAVLLLVGLLWLFSWAKDSLARARRH